MDWYRRYTDRAKHPQIFRAGFWGVVVFDALCDICAEFDLGGVVPLEYVETTYLANRLGLTGAAVFGADPELVIEEGLGSAEMAGLVTRGEHGVAIDGWQRRQPRLPQNSTVRSRKRRDRLRATRDSVACNEVQQSATDATRTEERRREEKRGEEKRGEEKRVKIPPTPLAATNDRAPPAKAEVVPSSSNDAIEFWRWFQDARVQHAGLVREKYPHPAKLSAFYSEALLELGGNLERLKAAVVAFGEDKFWEARGYPFDGFVSGWRKYVPRAA